jgi:MFS family permease
VIARYRALFQVAGFTRLLASSLLGRLPSGMFSLAILLFVHAQTGSFLDAGLAVGAFTLAGSLVGPVLGGLVDRVGQTRVLLASAAAQSALLVALVLVGDGDPAHPAHPAAARIVGVAALAGAALPPIAGCTRALWAEVADGEALQTVYSFDATVQELIWTVGPLLVGLVAGLVSPSAAVLLCAAVVLCGTLFFASSTLSRGWQGVVRERSRASALASPGLRTLLGSVALAGVVIGAIEVGLPALAVQRGAHWSAGPLMAVFSVGSMAGGLAYSARIWSGSVARRYAAILLAMAVAVAPLIVAPSLTAAFVLAWVAGLGIAPMMSCQFWLVGALAPVGTTTEAFTWHRAATVGGMAAGSALGGSLIDAHGAGGAFALGCAGVALAGALAALRRGRIEPVAAPVAVEFPVLVAAAVETPTPVTLAASAVTLAADAMAPVTQAPDAMAPGTLAEVARLAAKAVGLAADAVALAAR